MRQSHSSIQPNPIQTKPNWECKGANSQPVRPSAALTPYLIVGQSIEIQAGQLVEMKRAHELTCLEAGNEILEKTAPFLNATAKAGLLCPDEMVTLNTSLRHLSPSLLSDVTSLADALTTRINERIVGYIKAQAGSCSAYLRHVDEINQTPLFSLSYNVGTQEDDGLMLCSNDFFIHFYAGLDLLPASPLKTLYVTLLDRLSFYTGSWQTDVVSLFNDNWTMTSSEQFTCVGRLVDNIRGMRDVQLAIDALGEDALQIDELISMCSEQFEMMGITTTDMDDSDINDVVETVNSMAEIAYISFQKAQCVSDKSITELVSEVQDTSDMAVHICEVAMTLSQALQVECKESIEISAMSTSGDCYRYTGFVICECDQEKHKNLKIESQENYEHLMNAGEAGELLLINLDEADWFGQLQRFGLALTTMQMLMHTVTSDTNND